MTTYIILTKDDKGNTQKFDSTTDKNKVQEFIDKAASYPNIVDAWVYYE